MPAPVLSVLIPAYNYAAGVDRILARRGESAGRVEYIVHDDSVDDAVATAVRGRDEQDVLYRRNAGPGNAIANWNGLLDRAQGEFVVLVHHDEFPSRAGLFEDLAAHLADPHTQIRDVYLLGLRRLRRRWPMTDKLVPDFMRFWLLRHFPAYLSKRNFVGPSATFVVRRALCPRFDESLRWLVDVDFYLRTLQRSGNIKGLGQFGIVSETDRRQSITRGLGPEIADLRSRELAVITARQDATVTTGGLWLPAIAERTLWLCARFAGALCLGGHHGG
ncbi:MAG: glycosyltransferase [Alphaproteobacteria bacterium]|nr:glycosyltransferase [Alphaproteobacteria bacterium]